MRQDMITVINIRREEVPDENTPYMYCGRPSPLGNPFSLTVKYIREEVIRKYRGWLLEKIAAGDVEVISALMSITADHVLGCWCSPLPCHCDVIKEVVENLYLNKGADMNEEYETMEADSVKTDASSEPPCSVGEAKSMSKCDPNPDAVYATKQDVEKSINDVCEKVVELENNLVQLKGRVIKESNNTVALNAMADDSKKVVDQLEVKIKDIYGRCSNLRDRQDVLAEDVNSLTRTVNLRLSKLEQAKPAKPAVKPASRKKQATTSKQQPLKSKTPKK